MARPNYNYEKRRRELAKKKKKEEKKEEKRLRKLEKNGPQPVDSPQPSSDEGETA